MTRRTERTGNRPALYSTLYCRFNGFMFGVLFDVCRLRAAREPYPFLRRRMQLFLEEIAAPFEVPERHEDFEGWSAEPLPLLCALAERSPVLVDFFTVQVRYLRCSLNLISPRSSGPS